MTNTDPVKMLRLVARIVGSLALAFLLFMLIGHVVGDANGPNGMRFGSAADLYGFLLFPVCTILGLGAAYKWPLIGGTLAMASIVLLASLRPSLIRFTFLVWVLPGALYVVSEWLALGRRVGVE